MARRYDVLVVSDYFLDLVFTGLPKLPELGQEVFGAGFSMVPGGGFISAAAMHRLGLRIAWVGDFGSDDFSRFVLEAAEAEGIDVSLCVRHSRPLRRVTVSATCPEDRAFISYCDPEPAVPAAFKALASASAEAVYLGGLVWGGAFDAAHAIARGRRMKLVMDGNGAERASLADPGVRRALSGVDVFVANAREARHLTGEPDHAATLAALGRICRLPILKAGESGSYALVDGGIVHAPAIPVTPVDTTGAGDCFDAGFLKAWLEGRPVEECLRWGNAVGGLSTTAPGGAGRVITPEDVAPYISSGS